MYGNTLSRPGVLPIVAGAAAPAWRFSRGASLVEFRIRGALGQSLCVVALKLVVHPLLVWLLAAFVFRLPPLWVDIAVLCAGLPTGANVFLLAQRHGVYVQRSATRTEEHTSELQSLMRRSYAVFRLTNK